MKAISLWQPWASAMAIGLKTIETRHWSTNVRGLVAIHAAKRWTAEERDFAAAMARHFGRPELAAPPLGAVVATGYLTDIRRSEDLAYRIPDSEFILGNYSAGRFGWIFKDVVALPEPIPCRGAQGFFEIPDDLSELTREIAIAEQARAPQPDLFGGRA